MAASPRNGRAAAPGPDLAPFLSVARARIARNKSGDAVALSPAMKRGREPSEHCAFAKVRRSGTDRSDPRSNRAGHAALTQLQRAREVQLCGKTLYPTQKERRRRVESFVNRAYFRLDAMNQATRLRRQRDAGDALRTDAPVNTALFRFGDLLRDLGPQMHLVRRNVVEALR